MKKRFIKLFRSEKENYKMINQSENGFVLIIVDIAAFNEFMGKLNSFSSDDQIFLAWQWKHKTDSCTLYRECVFSAPEVNYNVKRGTTDDKFAQGMRFNVTCKDAQYFSYTKENKAVPFKKEFRFKSGLLLDRMLKISELDTD